MVYTIPSLGGGTTAVAKRAIQYYPKLGAVLQKVLC